MKNIIIGTAGHVDHGKTSLIKVLSGIDTDRLSEEKKRGITIELGFAHIPNDEGYNIGVIDVPGHEKFIKNMLAGIGGIDFVVFVVAADEGIMPQTKEHFEILSSLGIDDGIIAVTKTDMVDEEWLEMLLEEVEDYFKGSFLEGKPIIPVSSRTGENVDLLKAEILKKCDRENKRLEDRELFRLPIDRVFSMQGFGTVVTGTLIDGECHVGDELRLYPSGDKVKIRGIQTYGKDSKSAFAGQRTAINLSGINKEDIERGDVLAAENAVVVTNMLDVSLRVFSSSDRMILNNSRVHIYVGSKEAICKVILLDRDALGAGETCYAQLRLEEPIAIKRGDRFIVRFYSPIITIGGGQVIDALPDKHKRNKEDVLETCELLESGELLDIVEMKTSQRAFLKMGELARVLGVIMAKAEQMVSDGEKASKIAVLSDGSIVSSKKLEKLATLAEAIINRHHENNPLSDGIPRQELLSRLKERLYTEDEKLILAIIANLVERGVLSDRGKSIALAGFEVELSAEHEALKAEIAEKYSTAGIELVKNDEIYALADKNTASAMLAELADGGIIKKVDAAHYMSMDAWNLAVRTAASFGTEFTLAEYRDKLGTSRKYAEILLASLDKAGITRFNGKTRIALIAG